MTDKNGIIKAFVLHHAKASFCPLMGKEFRLLYDCPYWNSFIKTEFELT